MEQPKNAENKTVLTFGSKKVYLNEKKNYKIVIDTNRCKGCSLCVIYCPKEVLALSSTFSDRGFVLAEAIAPENCIACYKCENTCPDFAIYILRNNKTQLDKKSKEENKNGE
ncbi:MAG: 4Fe-4S dicluster domain-containing protein [Candidatus Odinarchaeota archaeon]